MKVRCLLLLVMIGINACESAPPPRREASSRDAWSHYAQNERARPGGSSTDSSVAAAAAPNPSPPQQIEGPPQQRLLYQSTASDGFGRSSQSGVIQQSGAVYEELHIGTQQVMPGQPLFPPVQHGGVLQPGFVPAGTTAVRDPVTGRLIPVRRP